jgi:hypothetical protein
VSEEGVQFKEKPSTVKASKLAFNYYSQKFTRNNNTLLSLYGIEIGTYVSILVAHYETLIKFKLIEEGGYFFIDYEAIEQKCGLYERQQVRILKILHKDFGLLKYKKNPYTLRKEMQIQFDVLDRLITKDITVEKHLTKMEKAKINIIKRVGLAKKQYELRNGVGSKDSTVEEIADQT